MPTILAILGQYTQDIKRGDNLDGRTDLLAGTIRNYLTSAVDFLRVLLGRPISILDPLTLTHKTPSLNPFLKGMLGQRTAWQKPKARILPWTGLILESLVTHAAHDTARLHYCIPGSGTLSPDPHFLISRSLQSSDSGNRSSSWRR
jgi:hypothetical protein